MIRIVCFLAKETDSCQVPWVVYVGRQNFFFITFERNRKNEDMKGGGDDCDRNEEAEMNFASSYSS